MSQMPETRVALRRATEANADASRPTVTMSGSLLQSTNPTPLAFWNCFRPSCDHPCHLPAIQQTTQTQRSGSIAEPESTVRSGATLAVSPLHLRSPKRAQITDEQVSCLCLLILGFEVAPTVIFAFYGAFVFSAGTFGYTWVISPILTSGIVQ